MGYPALTPFLQRPELPADLDQWSHERWLDFVAKLHQWQIDLPFNIKADVVMLMDAAAKRATEASEASQAQKAGAWS